MLKQEAKNQIIDHKQPEATHTNACATQFVISVVYLLPEQVAGFTVARPFDISNRSPYSIPMFGEMDEGRKTLLQTLLREKEWDGEREGERKGERLLC